MDLDSQITIWNYFYVLLNWWQIQQLVDQFLLIYFHTICLRTTEAYV